MTEVFKFNFSEGKSAPESSKDDEQEPEVHQEPAVELTLDLTQKFDAEATDEVVIAPSLTLLKATISAEDAAKVTGNSELAASDLVPGQYEGGFKVWEGSIDLCKHICKFFHIKEDLLTAEEDPCQQLRGKRVLELGCGHGLPGILAMLAGAEVHFQDYNADVLKLVTLPNIIANRQRLPKGRRKPRVRFFAGDWGSFGPLLTGKGLGGYYDYVFTAETIYSKASQERLLTCINQVLQPPHGQVFLAAKSYYFGVGGSVADFKALLQEESPLECQDTEAVQDTTSVKREVLRLGFPICIMPYFL